jgi:HK97 family phage major capsid protein
VQPLTILGRLQGKLELPFNTRTLSIVDGSTAHWVGPGKPKPLTRASFAGEVLSPLKMAAPLVITKELAQLGDARSEALFTSDLTRSCTRLLDESFISPDNAGVPNEKPASITSGATPIPSSGDPAADVGALIGAFNGDLASAFLITDPLTGAELALARDAGGSFSFPDASSRGGSILGFPLLISRSSPRDSSGGNLVLLDASAVGAATEGVRVSRSEQATVQMSDTPDNPATASTVRVSLWQANLVGLLVELFANWKLAAPDRVAVVTGANYASAP